MSDFGMKMGKNVKFRDDFEKSPSPKRFVEPDGMTDVDLRRLSQISSVSDCSLQKSDSHSLKKQLFTILFTSTCILCGCFVLYLLTYNKGFFPMRSRNDNDLTALVLRYVDKLDRCKKTKHFEDCCAIFIQENAAFTLQDCNVEHVLDALQYHQQYNRDDEFKQAPLLLDYYDASDNYFDLLDNYLWADGVEDNHGIDKHSTEVRTEIEDIKQPAINVDGGFKVEVKNAKFSVKSKRNAPDYPHMERHFPQIHYDAPVLRYPEPPAQETFQYRQSMHSPMHNRMHNHGHDQSQFIHPEIAMQFPANHPINNKMENNEQHPHNVPPYNFNPDVPPQNNQRNADMNFGDEIVGARLQMQERINADNKKSHFEEAPAVQAHGTPCIATYTPPSGSIIQQQAPYFASTRLAQIIPMVPRTPANSYVINPQFTYVAPNYPQGLQQINGYAPVYPSGQIQPAGQYYLCNPLPQPTNNIAGLAGVEVRSGDDNFQQVVGSTKNQMRDSDLCNHDEQMCADKSKCIKTAFICDDVIHCPDNSDEAFCSCKYRIDEKRLCDGYLDCPHGEDEIECFGCPKDAFICDDWKYSDAATCIPMEQRCDGVPQCPSEDDEKECSILLPTVEMSDDTYKLSNNVGFLHRNYRGVWYPACMNAEVWALDACKQDAEASILPPLSHLLPILGEYNGLYANPSHIGAVEINDTCMGNRAVHVECPQPTCGIRKLSKPMLRADLESSDEQIMSQFKAKRDVDFNETIVGVVGGKPCQPAAWPWVVSIYKNGIFHCGGVLITESWLITAAHCVEKYWNFYYEIEVGMLRRFSFSPIQQVRHTSDIIAHEGYDRKNLKNDIALMRLNAPVKYNKYVRPICLPTEFTAGLNYDKGPKAGTICTAVGWGATREHGPDPDHMREVDVPILAKCKRKEDIEGNEICAGYIEGGKDACQGDSGGPFLCRNPNNRNQWYLAGIVSHGEGCARPNEPGVYTRVSSYMDWIYENAKDTGLPLRTPLHHCPGYVCKKIKRCIAKKRRCDKVVDCLYGDDEVGCDRRNSFSSLFERAMRNMFNPIQISRATNIDLNNSTRMDGEPIMDENGQEDDAAFPISDQDGFITNGSTPDGTQGKTAMIKPFKSQVFLCEKIFETISVEKRCDKIFDCEDGSDELTCTCADYLKTSHPEAICDGVVHCTDLTDESDCDFCREDEFYCRFNKTCIPLEKKCDNNVDCLYNEDEWDCFALTNKYQIELDADKRPRLYSKGVLAFYQNGIWRPMCGNFTGIEGKTASDVCITLGFSDYERYLQLIVNDAPLKVSSDNDTAIFNDTCNALYIHCSNTSIGSHEIGYEDSLNVPNEMYFTPWNAAIYANGDFKCTGTILDVNWILSSINCFPGVLKLNQHYVAVVLGAGYKSVGGPHEQIIPVVETLQIGTSNAILLRLKERIAVTRYVRPINQRLLGNALNKARSREVCVAIGMNSGESFKSVVLQPVQNCTTGFRCFKRLSNPPMECKVSNETEAWSGCIVCDAGNGFYPATVFHEPKGECGFKRTQRYQSLSFLTSKIAEAKQKSGFVFENYSCNGFRCKLGNCIDLDKKCNGIVDCRDAADEDSNMCAAFKTNCHLFGSCVCAFDEMRCANGKCIKKYKFCDRVNDCGDLSDEPDTCNCHAYLNMTNPAKICDGITNCMDKSDENPDVCKCSETKYFCTHSKKCVANDVVCDGQQDCPDNEDESTCIAVDRMNDSEVVRNTNGIWHSGCFAQKYTITELENICKEIGYYGLNVKIVKTANETVSIPSIKPFETIRFHSNSSNQFDLSIRYDIEPIKYENDPDCYKLFLQCDRFM